MCKPSDYSPFVGRQRLSSFAVWRAVGRENLFSRCLCRLTYAKLVPVSAMKICFSDCRTPPNLCNVSAS